MHRFWPTASRERPGPTEKLALGTTPGCARSRSCGGRPAARSSPRAREGLGGGAGQGGRGRDSPKSCVDGEGAEATGSSGGRWRPSSEPAAQGGKGRGERQLDCRGGGQDRAHRMKWLAAVLASTPTAVAVLRSTGADQGRGGARWCSWRARKGKERKGGAWARWPAILMGHGDGERRGGGSRHWAPRGEQGRGCAVSFRQRGRDDRDPIVANAGGAVLACGTGAVGMRAAAADR
jgi:hypothetical protein